MKYISIRGAKQNNLKDVSVDIPRNKLTVITGVSGSGKSSLAFDTLYAEGQRRFVESLSSYARQFLERMSKPDVESITGLPPAVAIEQRAASRNPRSTVGTNTEIYDYLRALYGRIGKTICKKCGAVVRKDSPEHAVERMFSWDEGDKLYITFKLKSVGTTLKAELEKSKERGYFRALIAGSDDIYDLNDVSLPRGTDIDSVLILADRIVLRHEADIKARATDSIEAAFLAGDGKVHLKNLTKNETLKFSSLYECAECEIVYEEPEPRLFSFNNPQGACPMCQGFGRTVGIDDDLVIPDQTLSIRKGAIHPFKGEGFSKHLLSLMKICNRYNIPADDPYMSLSEEHKKIVWEGKGEYHGINGHFKELEDKSYKTHYRVLLSRYRGYTKCRSCDGSRLRTSARQTFVGGKNIPDLVKMPLGELFDFFKNLKLNDYDFAAAGEALNEIISRVGMLVDIGLEYISLSRLSHTLSGGETQRINLATALGSSLVGTLYVLDEPSIGMHPRDTQRLLNILYKLRNIGNTIVVVEHDPDIIKKADMVIDVGPQAGDRGGRIVFAGEVSEITKAPESLTGKYFSGEMKIEFAKVKREIVDKKISIFDARENNLKIGQLDIPTNCLTVVTGVSGSGKSTLIHNILYAGLRKNMGASGTIDVGAFSKITKPETIEYVEMVDQTPIGKSSRSTPVSYTKAFDGIREVFSTTSAARQLGWKVGHFSFNVAGGRCDECEGEGYVTVDMQFLPDVRLVCESCKGTRYKKEAGNILYKGKSIVDVLQMSVDEAINHFREIPKIVNKLSTLREVGLGYLQLGQPSSQLSNGESQRVKLATHLESRASGETLFIFDEPTTGLHLDDISNLLNSINRLVDKGNSVIIIEHNIHIIAAADWIIDLGPEAGDAGGYVIAEGNPDKIMKCKESYTGKALREFYGKS